MEYPKHLHKNDGSGVYVVVANEYDAAAVEAIGYGKPTVAPASNCYQEIPWHVALEEGKLPPAFVPFVQTVDRGQQNAATTIASGSSWTIADYAALDGESARRQIEQAMAGPSPDVPAVNVAPKRRGRPAKVKD